MLCLLLLLLYILFLSFIADLFFCLFSFSGSQSHVLRRHGAEGDAAPSSELRRAGVQARRAVLLRLLRVFPARRAQLQPSVRPHLRHTPHADAGGPERQSAAEMGWGLSPGCNQLPHHQISRSSWFRNKSVQKRFFLNSLSDLIKQCHE